jgi:hypothetical protein
MSVSRYAIVESCMRPSGAWEKPQATYTDEDCARTALKHATWCGPGYGLIWARTLTLRRSTWTQGERESEVLDERNLG